MAWYVNPLPVMSASHISLVYVGSCPSCSSLIQLPVYDLGKQQVPVYDLGPCTHVGNLDKPPSSDHLSSSHCGHLENEPVDGKSSLNLNQSLSLSPVTNKNKTSNKFDYKLKYSRDASATCSCPNPDCSS